MTDRDWSDTAFELFRQDGVNHVCFVPDSGLARLIWLCEAEPQINTVTLTSEEEGIAFSMGAWLGGEKAVLLMQSSGVGNCFNMLAAARSCGFPVLMVVTMRGQPGENNPWQLPLGQHSAALLSELGVRVLRVAHEECMSDALSQALMASFDRQGAVAVLIEQRLIGVKSFED